MENESKPFKYTDKHHNFITELVKMPPRHALKVEIQPGLWSQLVEGNLWEIPAGLTDANTFLFSHADIICKLPPPESICRIRK